MAVTIDAAGIVAALRLNDSSEELAEVTRILAYASDAVVVHVPNAPDSAQNEAVRRLCGYLYDMPEAARGDAYANAMRNSGAARMLLPYRRHRAGYADAITDAQNAVGTEGNPVVAVRVDGSHLVITFADGSHDTETLPAGSGIDSTARAAAVAAQSAADGAQALATQNETDKLELPDLVAGVGIALIPSGSRELTISTTGSISGPEELEGGQWRWVNTALADAGEVMYAGDVVLGQIDTWTFLASGAFFPSQAQLLVLLPGDTITIGQNTNRYQTIEVTSEPTVANNFVTVRGYADRANHAEIPQAFANVTIIISPGLLQGEDKTARDAAAAAQADIDQHETSTHNTDANARLAAQGAHVLAGQVQTDLNLHEHNHPTQGDDAFEWATEGNTDVIPTGKVNLDAVQNQIDDIHEQIAHSTGEISEVVGVLGAGNDSLRYTLPVNLDGVYDVSVRVKAKVQVNEFVTFTGTCISPLTAA